MHALDLAANLDRIARLELFLQCRNDLVDLIGNASEVATLHAGVNFVRWLDVGFKLVFANLKLSLPIKLRANRDPISHLAIANFGGLRLA